jgi:hypothetical protein
MVQVWHVLIAVVAIVGGAYFVTNTETGAQMWDSAFSGETPDMPPEGYHAEEVAGKLVYVKDEPTNTTVTIPVTVGNTDGKDSGNDEQPAGSPPASWQWAMPTASWDEVWRLTEPVAVTYGGERFVAYVPENGNVRRATLGELKAAWAATYGPGTGYSYSDSGAGANGWFGTLLRTGGVEVYQGPLDNQERRKFLIPYNTGDGMTRYVLVGKNQGSSLDSTTLKLGDEITSPEYNLPNQVVQAGYNNQPTETKSESDSSGTPSGDGGLTGSGGSSSSGTSTSSGDTGGLT